LIGGSKTSRVNNKGKERREFASVENERGGYGDLGKRLSRESPVMGPTGKEKAPKRSA